MRPTLDQIRRYPVKAMGGESLAEADVGDRGLDGDRWFAVVDADGRLASCKNTRRFRRHDEITRYRAGTSERGEVQVATGAGRVMVGDPRLDEHLGRTLGASVTVRPEAGTAHHDAGAVSIVGTASLHHCADVWRIDADARRLRPNLVVRTERPFEEEDWVGRQVIVGSVVLSISMRATRCRTIDLAQDGATAREPWLARLAVERDSQLAVYADVVRPGRIAVGDPVHVDGSA